jgi:hypothetical protein
MTCALATLTERLLRIASHFIPSFAISRKYFCSLRIQSDVVSRKIPWFSMDNNRILQPRVPVPATVDAFNVVPCSQKKAPAGLID